MESLAGGSFYPFNNWCSAIMSSACTHSGSDKQHYHRHCSCALHSIETGFMGASCSPSCKVKVSRSGSRCGMFRSLSVQNLSDKKFNCYKGDDSLSSFNFSPGSSDMEFASDVVVNAGGSENLPSVETLTLVEELASFIQRMRGENLHSDSDEEFDEEPAAIFWADEPSSSDSDPPNDESVVASNSPTASSSFVIRSTDPQLAVLLPAAAPLERESYPVFSSGNELLRVTILGQLPSGPGEGVKGKQFGGHEKSSGR